MCVGARNPEGSFYGVALPPSYKGQAGTWVDRRRGQGFTTYHNNQIITLYTLNLPDVICQLYLINLENKEGKAF